MSCADCGRIDRLRCGACGHDRLRSVWCAGDLPLANGLLPGAFAPFERYPLHMVVCRKCLAVQLTRQVDPAAMFERYPYFSSQSQTMLDSARDLAERVIRSRRLGPDSLVLEVGSNDGYLLRWYIEHGIEVRGIDPGGAVADTAESVGVDTERAFFDETLAERWAGRASVVHANNVLAHVPDPTGIVRGIARTLRPDGVLILETPWLLRLIDEAQMDTIYHEHRYYWSLTALSGVLYRAGLSVEQVEVIPVHGGSLRVYATLADRGNRAKIRPVLDAERVRGMSVAGEYGRIAPLINERIGNLREWMERTKPAAGYGAAAKGTMMLHQIGADSLRFVVDSTPAKQGRYLPGLGIQVLAPEVLEERMPADTVLLSWNFAEEVTRKAARYIKRGGRLWTTTPHVKQLG